MPFLLFFNFSFRDLFGSTNVFIQIECKQKKKWKEDNNNRNKTGGFVNDREGRSRVARRYGRVLIFWRKTSQLNDWCTSTYGRKWWLRMLKVSHHFPGSRNITRVSSAHNNYRTKKNPRLFSQLKTMGGRKRIRRASCLFSHWNNTLSCVCHLVCMLYKTKEIHIDSVKKKKDEKRRRREKRPQTSRERLSVGCYFLLFIWRSICTTYRIVGMLRIRL